MFENISADLKRIRGKKRVNPLDFAIALMDQGFFAVSVYRMNHWLVSKRIPLLHIIPQKVCEMITGISIPPTVKIGPGLLIEHFGHIVINSKTVIGANCTLTHGVTIGNGRPSGRPPVIGDRVYFCVGAKVLGDFRVGNECIIGADALVLKEVPDHSLVVGNPARVVRSTQDGQYNDFLFHGQPEAVSD